MTEAKLNIVVIGLSLSSSWGNGHATTYRALLGALAKRGHQILFLECDRPWYATHRDMPDPKFCRLVFYNTINELDGFRVEIEQADLVIVGSYVIDGVEIARQIRPWSQLLAFYDIDTPVTLARLNRNESSYISAATIPLYDLYLSFTGGPTLSLLEQRYGAKCARALFCAVDPQIYRPMAQREPLRWKLGYLGTYSPDRQPTLERLLFQPARASPQWRFVVAGPQYPSDIDWPANVEHIEHLAPSDHAEFYNNQAWTLNVTRADMIVAGHSPSVRLFEASACATPIISDPWAGLNDVFLIGREIAVATSSVQVSQLLAWPDQRRRDLGQAARHRVLNAHTAAHRAKLLEKLVADLSVVALSD